LRKSSRKRLQPLEFWKNEKVVYGRRQSSGTYLLNLVGLPVIVDVIKAPKTPLKQKKLKRKQMIRTSSKKSPEEVGYTQTGLEISGLVRSANNIDESEVLLAISGEKIQGEDVPGADFRIHTIFVEDTFMSAGMLTFPKPGSTKPSRNSSKHALAFFIVKGTYEVAINRTSFIAGPGSSFFVPRNNQYAIKNVGTDSGRLFFCHCRQ
jgi:centromere protein C